MQLYLLRQWRRVILSIILISILLGCRHLTAAVAVLDAGSHQIPGFRSGGLSLASRWCDSHNAASTTWQDLHSERSTVLGQADVHACSVLELPAVHPSDLAYTETVLAVPSTPGMQLHQVLLLDCDAKFWQLSGIQELEHTCLANTAALRASCNQWLLSPPEAGHRQSRSCAPPRTSFGRSADLQGRVMVLQAHWRLDSKLINTAVALPALALKLGAVPSSAAAGIWQPQPALLGSFVASAIYQPSSMSHDFPALSVPGGLQDASAGFMCGKRCTFRPLGRTSPQPVTVVGYSTTTFSRGSSVVVEVQRGWAGKRLGNAVINQQQTTERAGVVALKQPLQLLPGDVIRWHCTYNTSDVPDTSSVQGGFDANSSSMQEQCTVVLHYWPRVTSMRGCISAAVNNVLRGENMCSYEMQDLLEQAGSEAQQFPMRRMYDEHSFPRAAWMGLWKATPILLQSLLILGFLRGSQTLLAQCKALGSWHRRFLQLHPSQQRNVSLYVTHICLDTVCLLAVARPMMELWLGMTETAGDVRAGGVGFTYLSALYILELTWRNSVDFMLVMHHLGTIIVILIYAGELTPHTYRVSNGLIVLAAFALLEQPTYVALLLKRMLPASSPHVPRSARVSYISWFALKILSVLLASRMFIEDWHLMPNWIKLNFILTWLAAGVVQVWSGTIQYGIYRQAKRNYEKATAWRLQRASMTSTLIGFEDDSGADDDQPDASSHSLAPLSSEGSEDCIAAVESGELLGTSEATFAPASKEGTGFAGARHLLAAPLKHQPSSLKIDLELSPRSSGSLGASTSGSPGQGILPNSKGSTTASPTGHKRKQVRGLVSSQQVPAGDNSGSVSEDEEGSAGLSSGARVHHTAGATLQRRSRSGLLISMESGLGPGIARQEHFAAVQ